MPVKLILQHPLSCNSQKGREITLRHDSVVNDLHHGIRAAGGVCIKEPTSQF